MSKLSFLPRTGLTGMDVIGGPTPEMLLRMLPPTGLPEPSAKAQKFVACWFFRGLSKVEATPFEGVVEKDALAHISTLLKAMELGHTQKMTACAQLADMWFKTFSWTPKPTKL
jgi:hypothetical protein